MKATVTAYAKINLLLDVLYRRDDGYHEVEMVMQTIGLHDCLQIEPSDRYQLRTDSQQIPQDQSNLAYKAALLMAERYGLPPVSIAIEKHIPVAAGLAGGSSDGAAVLLGLNALFKLGLSQKELEELAAQLGSDVPFCLNGPTALATGRGERLMALTECPKLHLVLVKPAFGVSTPSVYKNLDLTMVSAHPDLASYQEALHKQDITALMQGMGNVLEQSTFALHPAVAQIKAQMQALGGEYTLMSGSGPTVFSIFAQKEQAERFYDICQTHFEQVYITETMTQERLKERVTVDD